MNSIQSFHDLCKPGKLTIKNTESFIHVLDNYNILQTLCLKLSPMHIVQLEYPYMYVQCTSLQPFHIISKCLQSTLSDYTWKPLLQMIQNIPCIPVRIDIQDIALFDQTNKLLSWTQYVENLMLNPENNADKYLEYIVLFKGFDKFQDSSNNIVCKPCIQLKQARLVDIPIPSITIQENINLFIEEEL